MLSSSLLFFKLIFDTPTLIKGVGSNEYFTSYVGGEGGGQCPPPTFKTVAPPLIILPELLAEFMCMRSELCGKLFSTDFRNVSRHCHDYA